MILETGGLFRMVSRMLEVQSDVQSYASEDFSQMVSSLT